MLIEGLAEFEKLSHEVKATPQKLEDTLFGDNPKAFAIVARWQGDPVGMALYFYSYSTFLAKPGIYLEDLFVLPKARGRGIGESLLRHLASLCIKEDLGRLEWSVLDWNKDAIRFYERMGALPQDQWTMMRVTGNSLLELGDLPSSGASS